MLAPRCPKRERPAPRVEGPGTRICLAAESYFSAGFIWRTVAAREVLASALTSSAAAWRSAR